MCTSESRVTPPQRPEDPALSLALDVDDELRDLEIDGYRVVFTRRVGLLPVELTPVPDGVPQS